MKLNQYLKEHKHVKQFFEYWIGGGLWFCVGYGAFAIFYSGLGWGWLPAKITGDLVGWAFNYIVQRYWAFNDPQLSYKKNVSPLRYIGLTLFNVLIDYAIVGGLYHFGITPYFGAFAAAGFFTVWNYLWYRFYVFRTSI